MKKIIHKLRKQPDQVKRHILHFSTMVAGMALFSIWLFTLGGNLNDTTTKINMKENLAPLSVLKSNLEIPKW
ncbi:MAG: hypothetical protein KA515_02530 [Candidatus Pacebacteria bacterium]|nr:hypothetical protein [Candidatus Paceibacterota bacterium]